jgi:predicted transcriptional regulator
MDDFPQIGLGAGDDSSAAGGDAIEARRAELRAAVKRGLEDIEEGRVVDLDSALDRIEAMLDELEASRPS